MNKIYHLLLVGLLALVASCEQKDLYYLDGGNNGGGGDTPDVTTNAKVGVDVDWSAVKEKPSSMTVLVYSDKGYYLREKQTDSLKHTDIYMPLGYSSVMVVGDSTSNLKTIGFRSLDKLAGAHAYTLPLELDSCWYNKYAKDEKLTQQPDKFMTARKDSVQITKDILNFTTNGGDTTVVTLKPTDCVQEVTIRVRIKNIYRLVSVAGAVTGLAEGYHLKENVPTEVPVTHLIDSCAWERHLDINNPMNGYITCKFKTFGCPGKLNFKLGDYDLRLHLQYSPEEKWDDELILDIEDRIIWENGGWIIDLTDRDYVDMDELPNDGDGDDDGNGDKDDNDSTNGSIHVEIEDWQNESK